MANYERAAGGSLDEFDDLLTQQARQHLPWLLTSPPPSPLSRCLRLGSPAGDHPRGAEIRAALFVEKTVCT